MTFYTEKEFKIYKKKSGNLIPFSFKKDVPFAPKRVFLIYGKKAMLEQIMLITNANNILLRFQDI